MSPGNRVVQRRLIGTLLIEQEGQPVEIEVTQVALDEAFHLELARGGQRTLAVVTIDQDVVPRPGRIRCSQARCLLAVSGDRSRAFLHHHRIVDAAGIERIVVELRQRHVHQDPAALLLLELTFSAENGARLSAARLEQAVRMLRNCRFGTGKAIDCVSSRFFSRHSRQHACLQAFQFCRHT